GVALGEGQAAEPGDNTGRLAVGNAGEYHVTAVVKREDFSGVSDWQFPLAWARKRGPGVAVGAPDTTGGALRLDRAEQAYWAETPWAGPENASAVANLAWDQDALHLSCLVTDDVHVSDANLEDLYENDSLQVYFDF